MGSVAWGIDRRDSGSEAAPFWMTPGLKFTTSDH
jgi:hypothetical protein